MATLLPEPKAPNPRVAQTPGTPTGTLEMVLLTQVSYSYSDCGHNLYFIRNEIGERQEYVSARFIVHRHVRPQLSSEQCETGNQRTATRTID